MVEHRLKLFAVAAALSLGAVAQAAAGGCCPELYGGCGCGPTLPLGQQVIEPYDISSGVYVVNQGPILSGPGHYLARERPNVPPPGGYPYVGVVFSGYPYGLQRSGGYPRGLYSPFTGYPYSEPAPRRGLRTYVNYQTRLGPARVYRRARY